MIWALNLYIVVLHTESNREFVIQGCEERNKTLQSAGLKIINGPRPVNYGIGLVIYKEHMPFGWADFNTYQTLSMIGLVNIRHVSRFLITCKFTRISRCNQTKECASLTEERVGVGANWRIITYCFLSVLNKCDRVDLSIFCKTYRQSACVCCRIAFGWPVWVWWGAPLRHPGTGCCGM